ncbi:nucleotidyltransferase domain-containing protein [Aureibacillus halotolerans]|uniref:Streptomycin adenylyltransferase n=1 Tax=Aureibacillus halotolerans TaxID=1508390 RepID=A0A4R6U405_9BACI|nr:nucleotidyltransferase domain-containing protein [Aureibacillus halotolerans]TDQ41160.1 streptomycin adenylyltransferase [Aureibacillus halotolerans]
MFTESERAHTLSAYVAFAKEIDAVLGIALVGSGARGFRDSYSDIDLLTVVKEPDDVSKVQPIVNRYFKQTQHIQFQKTYTHEEDIWVTCYLFGNHLGVDLGLWSLKKLRATKPHWRILFDRDDILSARLTATAPQKLSPSMTTFIDEALSMCWQFFRNAAVSIQRKDVIKARHDMDVLRQHVIDIICLSHGIQHDNNKVINTINDPLVKALKNTYETSFDKKGLSHALRSLETVYFACISSADSVPQNTVQQTQQAIKALLADVLTE